MSDSNEKGMTEDELLKLDDEAFMKVELYAPQGEEAAPVTPGSEENAGEGFQESTEGDDGQNQPEGGEVPSDGSENESDDQSNDNGQGEEEDPDQNEGKKPEVVTKAAGEGDDERADTKTEKTKTPEAEDKAGDGIDYKAAYDTLMAPFKANGEVFTPQNPQELIKLAQMGANYSKKMNGLKPHLKTVRMLEENGILDDAKLSFLIDLDRGEPEAIKKLLKDKNIDPMDVDTSEESTYKPVNRSVSDEDYNFTQTVEEVASTPEGKGMVGIVHRDWDTESKKILFQDPNILRVMFEQKQSGIYDQVAAEINRRRLLGDLRETPFLHAYRSVGEEMTNQGRFAQTKAKESNQGQKPSSESSQRVVARGTGKRTPVTNNDKVKAASSPQSRPSSKKPQINPLELSDEDFMKDAEMGARFS